MKKHQKIVSHLMKYNFVYSLATFLTVAAVAASSGPSWLFIHQDETPAELLK